MRAAEVIDRVRKMKTAEHLLIAGRDNPTKDYGPGILNCLGNDRFRAKYNSGDNSLHPSPSQSVTNDIEMRDIVGVPVDLDDADSSDEGGNEKVK